jgi:hypothetical protein
MEQQRIHQEDRVRRALERAKADPKKRVRIEHMFVEAMRTEGCLVLN